MEPILLKLGLALVVFALLGFKRVLVILSLVALLSALMPHMVLEVTSLLTEGVHALVMLVKPLQLELIL